MTSFAVSGEMISICIPIPMHKVSWIIGKSGSYIKQLCHKSRAEIVVHDEVSKEYGTRWKYVRITGDPASVDRAMKILHIRMENFEPREDSKNQNQPGLIGEIGDPITLLGGKVDESTSDPLPDGNSPDSTRSANGSAILQHHLQPNPQSSSLPPLQVPPLSNSGGSPGVPPGVSLYMQLPTQLNRNQGPSFSNNLQAQNTLLNNPMMMHNLSSLQQGGMSFNPNGPGGLGLSPQPPQMQQQQFMQQQFQKNTQQQQFQQQQQQQNMSIQQQFLMMQSTNNGGGGGGMNKMNNRRMGGEDSSDFQMSALNMNSQQLLNASYPQQQQQQQLNLPQAQGMNKYRGPGHGMNMMNPPLPSTSPSNQYPPHQQHHQQQQLMQQQQQQQRMMMMNSNGNMNNNNMNPQMFNNTNNNNNFQGSSSSMRNPNDFSSIPPPPPPPPMMPNMNMNMNNLSPSSASVSFPNPSFDMLGGGGPGGPGGFHNNNNPNNINTQFPSSMNSMMNPNPTTTVLSSSYGSNNNHPSSGPHRSSPNSSAQPSPPKPTFLSSLHLEGGNGLYPTDSTPSSLSSSSSHPSQSFSGMGMGMGMMGGGAMGMGVGMNMMGGGGMQGDFGGSNFDEILMNMNLGGGGSGSLSSGFDSLSSLSLNLGFDPLSNNINNHPQLQQQQHQPSMGDQQFNLMMSGLRDPPPLNPSSSSSSIFSSSSPSSVSTNHTPLSTVGSSPSSSPSNEPAQIFGIKLI